MSKVYIVSRIAFEYNDEVYHAPYNGESVIPQIAFDTKEEATAECLKLNTESYRGLTPGYYCYSIDDIINCDLAEIDGKVAKILNIEPEKVDFTSGWSQFEFPKDITDEQTQKLMKIFDLQFYTVNEVEKK